MAVVPEKSDGYPVGIDEGVKPKVTETTRRVESPSLTGESRDQVRERRLEG